MRPFDISFPKNEREATSDYDGATTRFLAGGTNLIDLMKIHVEEPDRLVDLNSLPFKEIEMRDGRLRIGALVSNTDAARHELVLKSAPILSQAILAGASPQLRNLATMGGNLLQRTRCTYFRDTAFNCNKRVPGSGCDALKGINRSHAIFGTSDKCIATSPSDMCVALAAMEADVMVRSLNGVERRVAFKDFYRIPGQTPQHETSLEAGEMIAAIEIQTRPFYTKGVYVKVRDRASYAFALTSAAVMIDVKDGTVRDVRIAFGGVATVPWRSLAAEEALRGGAYSAETFAAAARASVAGAKAYEHNKFKIDLIQKTLIRALGEAGGLA